MLGVGDFYYELGVQIIEVCLATSHRNGGKLSVVKRTDIFSQWQRKRSHACLIWLLLTDVVLPLLRRTPHPHTTALHSLPSRA